MLFLSAEALCAMCPLEVKGALLVLYAITLESMKCYRFSKWLIFKSEYLHVRPSSVLCLDLMV